MTEKEEIFYSHIYLDIPYCSELYYNNLRIVKPTFVKIFGKLINFFPEEFFKKAEDQKIEIKEFVMNNNEDFLIMDKLYGILELNNNYCILDLNIMKTELNLKLKIGKSYFFSGEIIEKYGNIVLKTNIGKECNDLDPITFQKMLILNKNYKKMIVKKIEKENIV